MLLDDAVIAPVFQRGLSYLQKPYVKDLYVHQFGPATSLKWADVQKKDEKTDSTFVVVCF